MTKPINVYWDSFSNDIELNQHVWVSGSNVNIPVTNIRFWIFSSARMYGSKIFEKCNNFQKFKDFGEIWWIF